MKLQKHLTAAHICAHGAARQVAAVLDSEVSLGPTLLFKLQRAQSELERAIRELEVADAKARYTKADTRVKRQSFGVWLKQFKDQDGAYGDLAKDMLQDCKDIGETPKYFKTPNDLYERMTDCGACEEALSVLEEVAVEYGQPLDIEDEDGDYDY
jgi:hypothetical protein